MDLSCFVDNMKSHSDFLRHTLCTPSELSFAATRRVMRSLFSWRIGANFHHHLGKHNHHNMSLAPIRQTEFLDEVLGARLHPITKLFCEICPVEDNFLLVFYHFDSFVETCHAIKVKFSVGSSSIMLNLWCDEYHTCSNAKKM